MSKERICLDCKIDISNRGGRSVRCQRCAKAHFKKWRKEYDAKPELKQRRREYDKNPIAKKRSKFQRNRKVYLLNLFIYLFGQERKDLADIIDTVEAELRAKRPLLFHANPGETPPILKYAHKMRKGKNQWVSEEEKKFFETVNPGPVFKTMENQTAHLTPLGRSQPDEEIQSR